MEEEDEVVGAISLIFCSVPNKLLMNSMFARLLSPSYGTVRKLVSILLSLRFHIKIQGMYLLGISPTSEAIARTSC